MIGHHRPLLRFRQGKQSTDSQGKTQSEMHGKAVCHTGTVLWQHYHRLPSLPQVAKLHKSKMAIASGWALLKEPRAPSP